MLHSRKQPARSRAQGIKRESEILSPLFQNFQCAVRATTYWAKLHLILRSLVLSIFEVVIYNKKYKSLLLFLALSSGNFWYYPNGESNTVVFCYVNGWLGKHLRMGAVCLLVKPTMWLEGWDFSISPLTAGEGKAVSRLSSITNSHWFNQLCFCIEASVKTLNDGTLSASQLMNMWRFGDWCTPSGLGRSMSFLHASPYTFLASGCSKVISFYNKPAI